MNIAERVFIVVGSSFSQRRRAIENITKKISGAAALNTLTFYGPQIDLKDLQERIFTFSFSRGKLVVFKQAQSLSKEVREFLFNSLSRIISANCLILEMEIEPWQLERNKQIASDKFFGRVLKNGTCFKFAASSAEVSLEDFKRGLRRQDLAGAVYILERLFESGSQEKALGPLTLGILVNQALYLRNQTDKDRWLQLLWEADRAMKGKGVSSRLLIQTLLVKLFGS